MTEHLYTPAGIRNGTGSSRYKGGDAVVVELLEQAIEKGANIEYDHGTVSLSETGYGESDGYYGSYYDRYDSSYTWGETTDRDLSLNLSTYGDVGISEEEEMVPESFFEDKDPEDETFEPTGNEGVNAERQYADAEAIVVWPRSQRWVIVTNDRTSEMCDYLLNVCTEGSADAKSKEECIKKAKVLIPRVIGIADVKTLMKCILMIGDVHLAENFLTSHLSASTKLSLNPIVDHLHSFIDSFGTDAMNQAIEATVNETRFAADPTAMANFLVKYCSTLGEKPSNKQLTENLIRVFVNWMSSAVPSRTPANSQLSLILGRSSSCDVKALMRCLLMIGDAQLAEKFLSSYLSVSTGSLDTILDHMQSFIDSFGADAINSAILTSVNATRFAADPTATSDDLLKYCSTLGKKSSNAPLTEGLIRGFVDSMRPQDKKDFCVPSKAPDNIQLRSILSLFAGDKCSSSSLNRGALARRVLEGYVWLSCQDVQEKHYYSTQTKNGGGPTLMPSAIPPLLDLCNSHVLIDAVVKLCIHGDCDSAIDLVKKIAPTNASSLATRDDRARICGRMASTVCEKILVSSQPSSPYHQPANLTTYKKLVKLISNHCRSKANRFLESSKTLDVDSFLYDLVTDASIRSSASGNIRSQSIPSFWRRNLTFWIARFS